jgi:hypothetical protein
MKFMIGKEAYKMEHSDYTGRQGHKIWNTEEVHKQKHGNGTGAQAMHMDTRPQINRRVSKCYSEAAP